MSAKKLPGMLVVEVAEIIGRCPIYLRSDRFHILEGYKLVSDKPLCMHALLSLSPYYVGLSRGIKPEDLGLAGPDGAACIQCLDPVRYTGGGGRKIELQLMSSNSPIRHIGLLLPRLCKLCGSLLSSSKLHGEFFCLG